MRYGTILVNTEDRTTREVLRDLNTALQGLGVEAGEHLFSDMTRYTDEGHPYGWSAPWPVDVRWIAVFYVTGGNEGYYIHIDAISQPYSYIRAERLAGKNSFPPAYTISECRHDHRECIGLAKTYDRDNAAEIARLAAQLLEV